MRDYSSNYFQTFLLWQRRIYKFHFLAFGYKYNIPINFLSILRIIIMSYLLFKCILHNLLRYFQLKIGKQEGHNFNYLD